MTKKDQLEFSELDMQLLTSAATDALNMLHNPIMYSEFKDWIDLIMSVQPTYVLAEPGEMLHH